MSDTVISVRDLSKRYDLGELHKRTDSFRDRVTSIFKRNDCSLHKETIWALEDVSFDVRRGEVLGIVGRNGAGKSTLLKILSRITKPTAGHVQMDGRVGSLLEVGTGFHPELTGRENIYLNGAILGMRRAEVRKKFDEIVAFAETEKFLDTPVKRYSSGMYVRLAFSVAAHLEPEILLVDEVLAVGDSAFQKKCLGKMEGIASTGRTILFVSHNMGAVNNLCHSGLVIDEGRLIFQGEAGEAVRHYAGHVVGNGDDSNVAGSVAFTGDPAKKVQFRKVQLTNAAGQVGSVFEYSESPFVYMEFDVRVPADDYYAILFVKDIYGNIIFTTADDDLSDSAMAGLSQGVYQYQVQLPNRLLKPGRYNITVSLTQKFKTAGPHDRRDSVLTFDIVDNQSRRASSSGYRKLAVVAPEIPWKFTNVSGASLPQPDSVKRG